MLIKRIYSTAWNSISLFMLVYQYFIKREGFCPYNLFTAPFCVIYVSVLSLYRTRHAHTHKLYILRHFTLHGHWIYIKKGCRKYIYIYIYAIKYAYVQLNVYIIKCVNIYICIFYPPFFFANVVSLYLLSFVFDVQLTLI